MSIAHYYLQKLHYNLHQKWLDQQFLIEGKLLSLETILSIDSFGIFAIIQLLYQIKQKMNKENPFLKTSQSIPYNPMNQLLKLTANSSGRQIFNDPPSNPISQNQQNINENNIISTQKALIFPQSRKTLQDITKKTETISQVHQAQQIQMNRSNEKINVAIKINQQPCNLQQIKSIQAFQELKRQNIVVVLSANVTLKMATRLKLTAKMANCLSSLFQIIRDNNEAVLKIIKDITNQNKNLFQIKLRYDQINRLMQGLCFYYPVHNQAVQFLQKAMKNHGWGQLVNSVSKLYHLDCLKAYYVVRQVHSASGKIQRQFSQFTKIQQQNIMPQKQVLKLAEDFLQNDKKNLLNCYVKYLSYQKKPSDMNICSTGNEVIILWSNITMMERESPQIQWFIFQLFNRYRSMVSERQKGQEINLKLMKDKMFGMKLDERVMTKLYSIGADDELRNGQMRQQNFKGPYLDLYQTLINQKQIDYAIAIIGLKRIQALPPLWLPYLQKYVSEMSFIGNQQSKLLKGIYIYCILKRLKNSYSSLSKKSQEKLIKTICKQASLLLALVYSEFVKDKNTNIWLLQIFLRETQDTLAMIERRDSQIITKYIQNYKSGELINMELSLIQSTFKEYLQGNDLQTIQRQLSCGKIISIDFQSDKQSSNLQCVRYYLTISKNLPSQQQKIQLLVHALFHQLSSKKYSISKSLCYYNSRIFDRPLTSTIISRHLIFLLTADIQLSDLQLYLLGWLAKIQNQMGRVDFSNYIEFVCLVGETLLKTEKSNYMQILMASIDCFYDSILIYANSQTNSANFQVSSLRLFYILGKLIEYNRIHNAETELLLLQVRNKMKQILWKKNNNPIQLITQHPQINIVTRLAICCDLMSQAYSLKDDNDNKEDQFLLSSWIDRNDKETNKFELYNLICQQVEKEANSGIIDAFECAAKHQMTLFELMVKNNYIHLVDVLQKCVILSISERYKILSITIKMHKVLSLNGKVAMKRKQGIFINLVISKILSQFIDRTIPFMIYELVLDLLTKSMNGVQYSMHIVCLSKGVNQNYFTQSKAILSPSYGQYFLYILCLQLAKKTKGVDIQNKKEKNELMNQIRIFTAIGLALLRQAKKKSYDVMSDFHKIFFRKLVLFLICCLQQSSISAQILQNLALLRVEFKHYEINDDLQFEMQVGEINRFMNDDNNNVASNKTNSKSMQIKVCSSEQQYNQLLFKYINCYDFQEFKDREDVFIQRIMQFIEKNGIFTIKLLKIQKRFIENIIYKHDKLLIFMQLISKLLAKVNHRYYYKKDNIKTITTILSSIAPAFKKSNHHLQHLIIYKNFLNIIHFILTNSMLSVFGLLAGFREEFITILDGVKSQLEIETSVLIEDPNYLTLTAVKIETERSSRGYYRRQNFSLWNLLEYRQKLLLIEVSLSCCRCLNGVNFIKSHNLIATAINTMQFLSANVDKLKSQANKQKIQKLNMFLDLKKGNQNDVFRFVQHSFSLKQLQQICHKIGENISNLNFQLTSDNISLLETFNHQVIV